MPPFPPVQTASTIDQVIDQLSAVIDWSRGEPSRLGYFAALYRKVTIQVRAGIAAGHFDDGPRMERLDVTFANRYLQALVDGRNGVPPRRVWGFAFEAADDYWPIVLQHLLLGINAHINLDLGIAAAETMRGQPIGDLRDDFDRINAVLASLVIEVQNELAEIWMTLRLLDSLLGDIQDGLINFSIEHARDEAWRTANRFAGLPEADWPAATRAQDDQVLPIARLVRRPGVLLGTVTHIVRLGEVQDVARVVDILS